MSPTPDPDVVVDIATAAEDVARPTATARDAFSWNLDSDVLRDLLLRAG